MASIFSRLLHPFRGTVTHGVVKLYGTMTTSTSGTISTSSCDGFTITKATGSGRYTIQLGSSTSQMTCAELLGVDVMIVGPDANAYTDGKGIGRMVRDDDVATDGTFEIQFVKNTDNADAELMDAAKVLIEITLKQSSVNP